MVCRFSLYFFGMFDWVIYMGDCGSKLADDVVIELLDLAIQLIKKYKADGKLLPDDIAKLMTIRAVGILGKKEKKIIDDILTNARRAIN